MTMFRCTNPFETIEGTYIYQGQLFMADSIGSLPVPPTPNVNYYAYWTQV